MEPGLYLVGTPIGHLEDITLRALRTLREADVILAEDTRHTRKLLARHGIATRMISCHRFNEAARAGTALAAVRAGQAVALVTNAGMPCVSDPGARIVAACREAGLPVTVAPGPTAVSAALALSGFAGHGFHFEGFLPRKPGARARRLAALAGMDVPVAIYESPYRLARLLEELAARSGSRRVCVARELTKRFEEVAVGTAAELAAAWAARKVKGECVVVVAPAERAGRAVDTGEGG